MKTVFRGTLVLLVLALSLDLGFLAAANAMGNRRSHEPCSPGFHRDWYKCVSDQRSCVVNGFVGVQNWSASTWGACQAGSNCAPSFHKELNACVSNTKSCAITNGAGVQSWNGSGWSACQFSTCNSGFHQDGNGCVSNSRACVIANGTGTQLWSGTAWSACQISTCNTGFRKEGNSCLSNSRPCTIDGFSGTQTFNGATWGSCVKSTVCASGFHKEGAACLSNTKACSDNGLGIRTWSGTQWGNCVVSGACYPGFQNMNGTCVSNSGLCLNGCSLSGMPLFNQNNSGLNSKWFVFNGVTGLCGPTAAAMALDAIISEVKYQPIGGWTASSFKGRTEVEKIENTSALMGITPYSGTSPDNVEKVLSQNAAKDLPGGNSIKSYYNPVSFGGLQQALSSVPKTVYVFLYGFNKAKKEAQLGKTMVTYSRQWGHFVALQGVTDRRVILYDPRKFIDTTVIATEYNGCNVDGTICTTLPLGLSVLSAFGSTVPGMDRYYLDAYVTLSAK